MDDAIAQFDDPRLPPRFWAKCMPEPNSGCWLWFGQHLPKGYGQITFQANGVRKNVYVHRLAYERFVGEIPVGLQIDHRCRNTSCCNPEHLDLVTAAENLRRGLGAAKTRARHAARTHCVAGHEFDATNTRIVVKSNGVRSRCCLKCQTRVGRRERQAARARS